MWTLSEEFPLCGGVCLWVYPISLRSKLLRALSQACFTFASALLACVRVSGTSSRCARFLVVVVLLFIQEEKVGSPEKPLSDLGAAAYRSYWASVIIQAMQSFEVRVRVGVGRVMGGWHTALWGRYRV